MNRIIIILFLFFVSVVKAEEISVLEDSLLEISVKMKEADEETKFSLNHQFQQLLLTTLQNPNSFKYEFKKLTNITRLSTPDLKYNIFTWMLSNSDGIFSYYGFTQFYDKKSKKMYVYTLIDNEKDIASFSTYNDSTWYGILYYEMVPKKIKGSNTYLLLGFDANDWMTKKRVIEPLTFGKNGRPQFGSTVFKESAEPAKKKSKSKKNAPPVKKKKVKVEALKSRMIYEHSAQASMSLTFNRDLNMIVFDHLAPSDEKYKGTFAFYAPDFSYDGFVLKNNKWYLKTNLDARNPKRRKAKKSDMIGVEPK